VCFSPEVDLVAGIVVGTIGIDALRHVRRPFERPLAWIPVVLAVHLLIEVLVWWGLQDRISESIWRPAMWLYLAIAFGVLPVLVPVAVGALEPTANRNRVRVLLVIGTGVAVVLMYAVVRGPVEASIEGRHIDYHVNLWHGGVIVAFYVAATCGSLLVSDRRHVRWFGAVNLVVVCLLAWIDQRALISLWCAWATVTSLAIAVHLRYSVELPKRRRLRILGR
jgi:hypothetical protein